MFIFVKVRLSFESRLVEPLERPDGQLDGLNDGRTGLFRQVHLHGGRSDHVRRDRSQSRRVWLLDELGRVDGRRVVERLGRVKLFQVVPRVLHDRRIGLRQAYNYNDEFAT